MWVQNWVQGCEWSWNRLKGWMLSLLSISAAEELTPQLTQIVLQAVWVTVMTCCHLSFRYALFIFSSDFVYLTASLISLSFFFSVFSQGLLKKVYQESCRILTLSQRRTTSSTHPHLSDLKAFSLSQTQHHSEESSTLLDQRDKSSSNPPMSWQQEKRALQETVIALRELLCRMAQRHTQVSFCDFKRLPILPVKLLFILVLFSIWADHFLLSLSDWLQRRWWVAQRSV